MRNPFKRKRTVVVQMTAVPMGDMWAVDCTVHGPVLVTAEISDETMIRLVHKHMTEEHGLTLPKGLL